MRIPYYDECGPCICRVIVPEKREGKLLLTDAAIDGWKAGINGVADDF